jgi:cation transport ATPase
MEMSDVTFMDSNLSQLIFCLELGRKVISTIRENIGLSVVSKVVVVILTFYHRMTLLWAIASDVGVMLLVTLNGMKPLRSSIAPRNIQGDRHSRRKRSTTDTVAYNPLESDGVE